MKKPILYLNFNRPQCTRQSFAAIRRYKPERLYISVDGPRNSVSADKENVARVKEILSGVDWKCQVQNWYSTENLGCKNAVQKNLARFFSKEEDGIILEDDCVPSPSFFKFATTLLERYKNDDRIATIHGNSVGFKSHASSSSYFFTPFMNMWGWATWRRTYEFIDHDLKLWNLFDDKYKFMERILNSYKLKKDPKWPAYWRTQFSKVVSGEINTWDYQWIFSILEKRKFCIAPSVNLVENIGWGDQATHTFQTSKILKQNVAGKMAFPLKHPQTGTQQAPLPLNPRYEEHIKSAWCFL